MRSHWRGVPQHPSILENIFYTFSGRDPGPGTPGSWASHIGYNPVPVGVDRAGANLVFNSSLHGSVRLNGNNVLEHVQRIGILLAML